MLTAESFTHVHRDASGTAWIDDTGVKVIQVVQDHLGHGWSADVIHENYPHLSLAQIHASLAWFFDHEEDMEREIAAREASVRQILAGAGEGRVQRRLRQIKQAGAQ